MNLTTTLLFFVTFLALAFFAGWRGAQRWDPSHGVRMIPWRLIMLLSGAALFLLAIHLGALMGVPQRAMY